jgi:hypothetical protein
MTWDRGDILIALGFVVIILAYPIEALAPLATTEFTLPGGAKVTGIKPLTAITLFSGFILFAGGLTLKLAQLR